LIIIKLSSEEIAKETKCLKIYDCSRVADTDTDWARIEKDCGSGSRDKKKKLKTQLTLIL
jgi:hypothetical protein